MAETGMLFAICNAMTFVIKLVIKLTVNLVLELLKFGILTLLFLGVMCGSVIAMVFATRWTYVTSDGNMLYTVGVAVAMVPVVLVAFTLEQFIVKDVLKLTKMTLLEFVLLWLRSFRRDDNKPDRTSTQINGNTHESVPDKKDV